MAVPPKLPVSKDVVRSIFNEHYLPLVMSGQLTEKITRRDPATPASNQPPGTESIIEEYRDATGRKVAVAHYFWLPASAAQNGWRIGGSGVPEPKMVYWEGLIYKAVT
jgi:hypothetical protein